jgi:hypothetical protein
MAPCDRRNHSFRGVPMVTKRPDPWSLSDDCPWTKIFWLAAHLIDEGWPGDVAFQEARTRYENHILRMDHETEPSNA